MVPASDNSKHSNNDSIDHHLPAVELDSSPSLGSDVAAAVAAGVVGYETVEKENPIKIFYH